MVDTPIPGSSCSIWAEKTIPVGKRASEFMSTPEGILTPTSVHMPRSRHISNRIWRHGGIIACDAVAFCDSCSVGRSQNSGLGGDSTRFESAVLRLAGGIISLQTRTGMELLRERLVCGELAQVDMSLSRRHSVRSKLGGGAEVWFQTSGPLLTGAAMI